MMRPVTFGLFAILISPVALAQAPGKHLFVYRTEHDARQHCHNDAVVWADTRNHMLYLPRDPHYVHTHGGYVCESQARSIGYHGPMAHT
jgi:hypothetical protein